MNNRSTLFKRGGLSIALTCAVIALIILFNIGATLLAEKNYWRIDMTENKIFSVSDDGIAALKDINDEVTIIFCDEMDVIQNDYYQSMIYSTAKQLSNVYSNIKIEFVDIFKNPSVVEKYKKTPMDTITSTSVIIESEGETRVYPQSTFLVRDDSTYDPLAYDGEYKLISAILYVSADSHPKAYFTAGHDENVTDSQELWYLFEAAGYEVGNIDLMKQDIPEDTRFLIIHDPAKDFEGIPSDEFNQSNRINKTEIEKIDDFLDNYGCLMVFMDPDTPKFPELDAFLKEWGISFDRRTVKDYDDSLSHDGETISAIYATGNSYGADLVKTIANVPVPPKAIVEHATSINLEYDSYMRRVTSPVLMTGKNAVVVNDSGNNINPDKYNLMTLTRESRYVDNIEYNSYVVAVGSTNFASNDYIGQGAYSNRDILFSVMQMLGREKLPFDIEFEYFDNTELDITASQGTAWSILLITIFPLISFTACIVVLVRRRHA